LADAVIVDSVSQIVAARKAVSLNAVALRLSFLLRQTARTQLFSASILAAVQSGMILVAS
jgi:hypothetical protein